MTHFMDKAGNVYGFLPEGVEVTSITLEEASSIAASKVDTKSERISEIGNLLEDIDKKSERPMRAILVSESEEDVLEDKVYIKGLEEQAVTLREELRELLA